MFEDAMKMVKNVDDITHGTTEEQKEEMRFELSRKSARRLLLFSRESIAGRLFPPRFSEDMTVRKQNELTTIQSK